MAETAPDRDILDKFREWLEVLEGVTVYLGKSIDPEHDQLPAVTVVAADPAEMHDQDAPPELRWRLVYDFQADLKVPGDDPLAQLMDFARLLRLAVYHPEDRTMGGLATEHKPAQCQYFVPAPGSVIGSVLVRVAVDYVEDFYHD